TATPVTPPVQATPVTAQQPPPAQTTPPPAKLLPQPPPPVVAQQPPVPAGPSAQQMNEVRQQYNQLAIRVGAAKTGLRSIENPRRRTGMDLRGDMVEAESRMDYLMKESMDSIRASDPAAAKNEMQMAEHTLETIEKFLGR